MEKLKRYFIVKSDTLALLGFRRKVPGEVTEKVIYNGAKMCIELGTHGPQDPRKLLWLATKVRNTGPARMQGCISLVVLPISLAVTCSY